MSLANTVVIEWDKYKPTADMQAAIDELNQYRLGELVSIIPESSRHKGRRAAFGYRLYTKYPVDEVEKVYVLINGFAERAERLDAGVKGLLVDLLTKRTDSTKYAILVIGGLLTFPLNERRKLMREGSGALLAAADEVANLISLKFKAVKSVTVSGYSMGGTMAPLVAEVIVKRQLAAVDQVCCGEPNFLENYIRPLDLLKRVAGASAYRNEQIKASGVEPYIAVKTMPNSMMALVLYRIKLYRPLITRITSMRFVARDLALQAINHPDGSSGIQLQRSLQFLADNKVSINLLHAKHSILCEEQAFNQLVKNLKATAKARLLVISIEGTHADHGIEEQRSLSTPFLVMPKLYKSVS